MCLRLRSCRRAERSAGPSSSPLRGSQSARFAAAGFCQIVEIWRGSRRVVEAWFRLEQGRAAAFLEGSAPGMRVLPRSLLVSELIIVLVVRCFLLLGSVGINSSAGSLLLSHPEACFRCVLSSCQLLVLSAHPTFFVCAVAVSLAGS
jgi:hypothetical protein